MGQPSVTSRCVSAALSHPILLWLLLYDCSKFLVDREGNVVGRWVACLACSAGLQPPAHTVKALAAPQVPFADPLPAWLCSCPLCTVATAQHRCEATP